MRKFLLLSVVLLFAIVAMTRSQAQADPVPHDTHTTYGDFVPLDFWGGEEFFYFVQYGTGIVATHDGNPDLNLRRGWANEGTTLTWLIAQNPEDTYTYTYTWYTWDKDLSHIIIELTDGITIAGGQIDLPDLNDSFSIASYYPGPGNPGMPGDIYGIKIDLGSDTTDYTFSFTTDQAPVWGNFYAKDGDPIYAYNTGFESPETGVFIPRPDGAPIPEPATMLLLGAGLIGLAGIGRKRLWKR